MLDTSRIETSERGPVMINEFASDEPVLYVRLVQKQVSKSHGIKRWPACDLARHLAANAADGGC